MPTKLTKAQLVENIVLVREQLASALVEAGSVKTEAEFIVIVDGVPIDPDFENTKIKVGKVRINLPHLVKRFTYLEACAVADRARNAKGKTGIAVPWKDAVQFRLNQIASCLQTLQTS